MNASLMSISSINAVCISCNATTLGVFAFVEDDTLRTHLVSLVVMALSAAYLVPKLRDAVGCFQVDCLQ